jgi:hypothetical protein
MTYRFLVPALWELFDATDWYEDQSPGLGYDLAARVQERVHEIAAQPRKYWRVHPPVRGREIRQAIVRRFPFSIIYEVTAAEVVIVAVAHFRRRDRRWRRRL